MQIATSNKPAAWLVVLMFAVVYLVWGSTFLAIRVGVLVWPPLLMAGLRFAVAGALMLAYAKARGEAWPSGPQWRSIALLGVMLFVVDYGLLFWAERRIGSGMAAVLMATIPGMMTVAEITILRTQRMTWLLAVALAIGFAGVVVMMMPTAGSASVTVDRRAAVAILVGAMCWSVASVLAKKLDVPMSKAVSSGAQMLSGGTLLLVVSGAVGETTGFAWRQVTAPAWISLMYLIVAGSILGFTAYLWLMQHFPATTVGTYAYVNPVVAVLLGYVVLHERLSARTFSGALCVVLSVLVITLRPRRAARS